MTKYSILYIEDNPLNRTLIERFLEFEGFEVHLAKTGQEGLAQAAEILPDALLIDLNLPDLSGYDVIEVLSQKLETQHIPRIIFSADRLQKGRILPGGPNFYIQKPVDVHTLVGKIAYAIEHPTDCTRFEL